MACCTHKDEKLSHLYKSTILRMEVYQRARAMTHRERLASVVATRDTCVWMTVFRVHIDQLAPARNTRVASLDLAKPCVLCSCGFGRVRETHISEPPYFGAPKFARLMSNPLGCALAAAFGNEIFSPPCSITKRACAMPQNSTARPINPDNLELAFMISVFLSRGSTRLSFLASQQTSRSRLVKPHRAVFGHVSARCGPRHAMKQLYADIRSVSDKSNPEGHWESTDVTITEGFSCPGHVLGESHLRLVRTRFPPCSNSISPCFDPDTHEAAFHLFSHSAIANSICECT